MTAAARPAGLTALLAPIGMVSRGKNPRRDLGDLDELTASIRRHGVLLPLLVERRPRGGLQLIAGERRLAAARAAEQTVVPVIVRGPSAAPTPSPWPPSRTCTAWQ